MREMRRGLSTSHKKIDVFAAMEINMYGCILLFCNSRIGIWRKDSILQTSYSFIPCDKNKFGDVIDKRG